MDWASLNSKTNDYYLKNYAWNAAENFTRIRADFQQQDSCLLTIPRLDPDLHIPALILGSGPSLDEIAPRLSEWAGRGAIFASPSQLNILDKWEARADYLVAIDSNEDVAVQIGNRDDFSATLITHPCIASKTIDAWRGQRRYFRMKMNGPLNETQKAIYPFIRKEFPQWGCVNNLEVLIAHWLGYNPIFLAGVDFCFIDGKTRAMNYKRRGAYSYDETPPPLVARGNPDEINTTYSFRFYHLLLLCLWKFYGMHLVRASDTGAATELPFAEDVFTFDTAAKYPHTMEEIAAIVDKATLPEGIYAWTDGKQAKLRFHEDELNRAEHAYSDCEEAQRLADSWPA